MNHHLLTGGCKVACFSVEQPQEIVNPLAVGVQQLTCETDGIGEMQFLQVVDMHLQSECRRFLCLEASYSEEQFVRISPKGDVPRVSSVRGTNFCDLVGFVDDRTGSLVLLSALDNLTKGASGQAVQCLNLMFGLSEGEGLDLISLPPQ